VALATLVGLEVGDLGDLLVSPGPAVDRMPDQLGAGRGYEFVEVVVLDVRGGGGSGGLGVDDGLVLLVLLLLLGDEFAEELLLSPASRCRYSSRRR
jgi:hypothetical protein